MTSGFYPQSMTTGTGSKPNPYLSSSSTGSKPNPGCAECKRLLKILEAMRALPLPERVSYVYQGLINEALEGKP